MTHFEAFVAIDWSGAKGSRHKGIAVATCTRGTTAPVPIVPPGGVWSRTAVSDWIIAQSAKPVLIGLDFSFSAPWVDRRTYLPGTDAPHTARQLWQWVDALCDDEDLGATSLIETHQRRHFYLGARDGNKASFMHWRVCELAFNATGGGKASTIYDAIGAAQVSKASFAGMRLLNRVTGHLPIWPFDPRATSGAQLVEIYTTIAARAGGVGRGRSKLRSPSALDDALQRLGSKPHAPLARYDDHLTDAMIGAAWLRKAADDDRLWQPQAMNEDCAIREGWTFGII